MQQGEEAVWWEMELAQPVPGVLLNTRIWCSSLHRAEIVSYC